VVLPELLNRFGADGWELAGIQDFRDGGDGSSFWEASRLLTVYTFKRPYREDGWYSERGLKAVTFEGFAFYRVLPRR
jgi:hypothetical protein